MTSTSISLPATTGSAESLAACARLYEIPTADAACAISIPINQINNGPSTLQMMESCCGAAAVIPYSDCSYYCLAQDQSTGDLAQCLIDASPESAEVWCNVDVDVDVDGDDTIVSSGADASQTSTSSEGPTTPTPMPAKGKRDEESGLSETETETGTGTETQLEKRTDVDELQSSSNSVSITTAVLLALMVFGGAVRPVP
ncbi:hypothetical protein BDW74DRAFT_178365 [Aspergillus multicolor]|uniref:uncharacterized protein n=1 Tax=Aspergillus multicolor TaxID=41759 RepID=UPI003CCE18E6